MKITYKGIKREIKLSIILMHIFFYVLILGGLIWAIIDTNDVNQVVEGNVQSYTYGVIGFDSWYKTFFLWVFVLVIIGVVHLMIGRMITKKSDKRDFLNEENIILNKGDKERDVSACDYRKWSK